MSKKLAMGIGLAALTALILSRKSSKSQLDSEQYYRLRLTVDTSSDWANVTVISPSVIGGIEVSRSGDLTGVNYYTNPEKIAIGQLVADAQAGKRVSLTYDFVFSSGLSTQSLELLSKKGDYGDSHITLSEVTDQGELSLLIDDTYTLIPSPESTNPKTYSVPVTTWLHPPLIYSRTERVIPKTLACFYYAWYTEQNLSEPVFKDYPLINGPSNDPAIIDYHMQKAAEAGIDVMISSWSGPDSHGNANLPEILNAANRHGLKVTIYYESVSGGLQTQETIVDNLDYALTEYSSHPAFYHVNGKPFVAVYVAHANGPDQWKAIIAELLARGHDATYNGDCFGGTVVTNKRNIGVFDGAHIYGSFNIGDLNTFNQEAISMIKGAELLTGKRKIYAAPVCPGFDNELSNKNNGQTTWTIVSREAGAYYQRLWESAIRANPDMIFITSWNELWEHTHIQPSVLYGDQYIQMTRHYVDKWKSTL